MKKTTAVFIVLSILSTVFLYAENDSKAANPNTWFITNMFNMHYLLPFDEGDYTEKSAIILNINPQFLWFPFNSLGFGVDTEFQYFKSQFSDLTISIGPRIAYYLKLADSKFKIMPYAGSSFQYVTNEMKPGALENGWNFKFGLGISPVIGKHLSLPIEIGYRLQHRSSDYGEHTYSWSRGSLYIESGIGAFLWKKD